MKVFALFFLFISFNLFAEEKVLPNWSDPSEVVQRETRETNFRATQPVPKDFRVPAEYEEMEYVVLGLQGYPRMLDSIAKNSLDFGNVEALISGGTFLASEQVAKQSESLTCRLNSVWMRDYGPVGITRDGQVGIVDTIYRHWQTRVHDDKFPECLGSEKNIQVYKMDLILDGGNFMVDSRGNLFMTERTYLWNPNKTRAEVDTLLKNTFNVKTVVTFPYAGFPNRPLDGTGHIDMIIKLLADDKVIIAEATDQRFKKVLDEAVEYFTNNLSPKGTPYKIYRVPGVAFGRTWYTYANSLIVNNAVLVPQFSNLQQENKEAIAAYKRALPNHKIIGINSDRSIRAGGSIHCVSQLIPKAN